MQIFDRPLIIIARRAAPYAPVNKFWLEVLFFFINDQKFKRERFDVPNKASSTNDA